MLLVLPLVFFLCSSSFSSAQLCHPDDKAALVAFKNSFSNPNPFPSWDLQYHCCNWYGVECNETTNDVIGLDIASVDLNGTIPPSISKLKHLQHLRLHKMPNLVGKIPPQIGELPFLTYLVVSWTNISGPVPEFLAKLTSLMYLDLSFNRLSGSIPPSLPTLAYLYAIDLSRNHLTGPIPDSFGHFQKTAGFPALDLSFNMLSGNLPASLANVNFSQIDISRNNLSGDASVFFGKGKIASGIVISRNNLEFDFSKVSFMESLDVLDISHNKIYGSIPPQITDAVYLQALNVSYNRLCGKIPTGWKLRYRSESWDDTSFFHNKCLCGIPLDPLELCQPDERAALIAFKNSFSNPNSFPSWDLQFPCCNWYGVQCSNQTANNVIGLVITSINTIPPSISKLKHLQSLRLHKIPNLVGKIPPQIGELPFLTYLDISRTNISGPVPAFLAKLTRLRYLDLSFNRLSSPIPPSLPTLAYLYAIDLSRNHLTGPIPDSFGHFQKTAGFPALDLSFNMLSGNLPASLANVNFSQIDISRNNLSGDASVFFGKGKIANSIVISRNNLAFDFSKVSFMETLDVLDISHNKIYRSIPPQITDAVYLQVLNTSYNRLCGKIPTGWKLRYRSESWDNTSFFHNKCLCGIPLDPCK